MQLLKVISCFAIISTCLVAAIYWSSDQKQNAVEFELIRDVSVAPDVFFFDATKPFALHTKKGSVVYVTANSFEFNDGSEVKDNVELSFKEYHNVIDVIKSRIKMSYDSAGVKYYLQSAGMFVVTGESNGREVVLKNDKVLQVDLLTKTYGGKFNFYKFENDAWRFLHKDMSFSSPNKNRIEEVEEAILSVNNKINKIKSEMPFKPKSIDNNQLNVKIDFNTEEFPELAGFNDVIFEFIDENVNAEGLENIDWDYVEISKQESGIYQLSIYNDGNKYIFNTIPVLNPDQNTGVFATLFNKYEKELIKQQSIAKALNVEKMKLFSKSEDNRKSSLINFHDLYAKKSETDKTRAKLVRSFQISSFGMYNSDCPANLPEGPLFVADFKASDDDSLKHKYAYLVEKNTKKLFAFYPKNYNKFRCDPKSDNMIIILTDSNRIYACDNSEFSGVGSKARHEFSLDFKEINSDSELSIKKGLNF